MEDSFFLHAARNCKDITFEPCPNVTSETLFQVYQVRIIHRDTLLVSENCREQLLGKKNKQLTSQLRSLAG